MKANHDKYHLLLSTQESLTFKWQTSLNNQINRLHERCLRIIRNEKLSNFEELLNRDNSVSVHHNNIHAIAIEIYKVVNGVSRNNE